MPSVSAKHTKHTKTIEKPCPTCGKQRFYSESEISRGRGESECQPCSVKTYHSTRPPKKTKEEKKAIARIWLEKNKQSRNDYASNWRKRERMMLISLFGGQCAHCGENDPIVLDFDHIHNDGHKESGKNLIFSVKRSPEKFQLLCKNCNWRKEYWRRQDAKQK